MFAIKCLICQLLPTQQLPIWLLTSMGFSKGYGKRLIVSMLTRLCNIIEIEKILKCHQKGYTTAAAWNGKKFSATLLFSANGLCSSYFSNDAVSVSSTHLLKTAVKIVCFGFKNYQVLSFFTFRKKPDHISNDW